MYISTCLAYENLEVKVEAMDEHINLALKSLSTGNAISLTLNVNQVGVIAAALVEGMGRFGVRDDKLSLFGNAERKEAA